MKIAIVTGCVGFSGSHLIERLLKSGMYVIGVDNLFRGKKENIKRFIDNQRFEFIECDLIDQESVVEISQLVNLAGGLDYIYHYAAVNGTEHFYDKPSFTFYTNNKTTENVLIEEYDEA